MEQTAPACTGLSRVTKKSNLKQNYFIMQPIVHLCGGQNGTELGPPQFCKYVVRLGAASFAAVTREVAKANFQMIYLLLVFD